MFWFAQGKEYEKLEHHNLFDCIECGACSWVCPSSIPLVQYYRASKAEILQLRREHARAEHSRERFEARQERIAREEAEKAAKRAARKKALSARIGFVALIAAVLLKIGQETLLDWRAALIALAVKATIGVSTPRRRSSSVAAKPSNSGMWQSIRISAN